MSAPGVTDHALVRYLDRAGRMNVEGVRAALSQSLARAAETAEKVGLTKYSIIADGLVFVVVDRNVVTIYESRK